MTLEWNSILRHERERGRRWCQASMRVEGQRAQRGLWILSMQTSTTALYVIVS